MFELIHRNERDDKIVIVNVSKKNSPQRTQQKNDKKILSTKSRNLVSISCNANFLKFKFYLHF